ncbi:hypothetical protein E1B28_011876 [Marasmius oreades]|uniref:DUF7223 domain-containing protein n=1 Tax=Marasmius oreades TaxID=181124 RepID=A0A9P7RUZ8_9AGAR|nr:uncharacterized protein E1B28_011876 [Marasmius oreades]KAG7090279.1 hypothetical protein E1B28_011876 [Marasmius oreades]
MVNALSLRLLALLPFVTLSVLAENDWKTPCLNGVCQYSFNGDGSGAIKVWGSPDALTDITPAAGWEILDCSPDALAQDIRLVCQGDEDSAESGCAHLYQTIGAEGKVVRLPESCGKSAFARISKAWVPEDQSIPASLAKRLVRRDGAPPVVKALRIDTDFGAADKWKKVGPVNIAVQAANYPGADITGAMDTVGPQRRAQLSRRDTDVFIERALQAIRPMAVMGRAGEVRHIVTGRAEKDVNVNKTFELPPISLTKTKSLFDKSFKCPPTEAGLSVTVDSKGTATVSLGVVAIGTVVPPKFDNFELTAGLDAELDGSMTVKTNVVGKLDTGRIPIFEVGIPGASIPGILTIGPSFQIQAQATAQLEVALETTVGLNFKVQKATLSFPDKKKKSGGNFKVGDTPLTLSAGTSLQLNGVVEGHIVPTLNVGLNAFGNAARAGVFLEVDTHASLNLKSDVSAKVQSKETVKTSAGACAEVNTGISVDAGATASFFQIFSKSTKLNLFTKDFNLFSKCVGTKDTPPPVPAKDTPAKPPPVPPKDTPAKPPPVPAKDTKATPPKAASVPAKAKPVTPPKTAPAPAKAGTPKTAPAPAKAGTPKTAPAAPAKAPAKAGTSKAAPAAPAKAKPVTPAKAPAKAGTSKAAPAAPAKAKPATPAKAAPAKAKAPARRSRIMGREETTAREEEADREEETPVPSAAPVEKRAGAVVEALKCLANNIAPTLFTSGTIAASEIQAV